MFCLLLPYIAIAKIHLINHQYQIVHFLLYSLQHKKQSLNNNESEIIKSFVCVHFNFWVKVGSVERKERIRRFSRFDVCVYDFATFSSTELWQSTEMLHWTWQLLLSRHNYISVWWNSTFASDSGVHCVCRFLLVRLSCKSSFVDWNVNISTFGQFQANEKSFCFRCSHKATINSI